MPYRSLQRHRCGGRVLVVVVLWLPMCEFVMARTSGIPHPTTVDCNDRRRSSDPFITPLTRLADSVK
jgi:hypothetical protein